MYFRFYRALNYLEISLPSGSFKAILRQFDSNDTGILDVGELVTNLAPPFKHKRLRDADDDGDDLKENAQ